MVSVHARLVSWLEEHGGLNRELEALPSKAKFKDMDEACQGLTSPELATLLAHVKLGLKEELLASDLPSTLVFASRLPEYFPSQLCERFGDAIPAHPLSQQITTALLINEMVDGGGITYAFRLAEEINASATDSVRAFAVVARVYDLPSVWRQIDAPLGWSVRIGGARSGSAVVARMT